MDNNLMTYQTPLLEVIEMSVEQGFATSVAPYPGFGEEDEWD